MIAFSSTTCLLAFDDEPALHSLWPIIKNDMAAITNTDNNDKQLAKIRGIIDGLSSDKLNAIPTNQLAETLGQLSAAIFILGKKGDISDTTRLMRFVNLHIPSSAVAYYVVPYLPDVPVEDLPSSKGESARQQFPACFSLSFDFKGNPNSKNEALLNSATNDSFQLEANLRILGVLIDSGDKSASEYAERIKMRFGSEKVSLLINDLKYGTKSYWSSKL